jgi:hypothetical protein
MMVTFDIIASIGLCCITLGGPIRRTHLLGKGHDFARASPRHETSAGNGAPLLRYDDAGREGHRRCGHEIAQSARAGGAQQEPVSADNKASYGTAVIGSLRLADDYAAMAEMFMVAPPSFDELMTAIAALEAKLNG